MQGFRGLHFAGDVDGAQRKRLLLIQREMGVPSEAEAGSRWSLDHLFIDEDSVPILVEVKRSSDTRIRREVVGQMLDYAANASSYWRVDALREAIESACRGADIDPDETVASHMNGDADIERFWQDVTPISELADCDSSSWRTRSRPSCVGSSSFSTSR